MTDFIAEFELEERKDIEATFQLNVTKDGKDGKDATINGYNVAEIVPGVGIDVQTEDGTITISNTSTTAAFSDITGSPYDNDELAQALNDKQNVIDDLSEIRAGAALGETAVQPSELSAVATSGNYNDLTNKPTIGNATLTIQKNGTAVDTFTANATNDKTINITVPTQPSDIGAATSAQGQLADSALQPADITTGSENGTISVDGSDVQVNGLGTAAYTDSDNYATAAQGSLADSALQPEDITTGSTNGTISVDGTDVAVKGLGSAAYTPSTDYATAAQGSLADSALQPSDVVNNTTSTATDAPLSANMGKSLQTQIDNLNGRGRYLALWNCATGLAQSNPPQSPYTYKAGDYFIVGTVASAGGTDYRPSGSSYTTGVASTVVETEDVAVNDVYYYDGTTWSLQINTQKEVAFVNVAGDPYDNTNLANALNSKVTGNSAITGATKCKITYDSKGLVTSGADLSATDIPSLSLSKITDVTATASELNVLDGITATTTELNYVDGVTSSIQTQLNGKVASNTAITGATKCKITYDSKGLVTAGANLSSSDIPDLSSTYQPLLVSGTNIKTINNETVLGSGNINTKELPAQSGNSGKFLTTNGTDVSWATVDALPSQTSQSGKFLTTNGTTASWANVPTEIPSQSGQSGKVLTTNGSAVSWTSFPTVDQTYNESSVNAQSGTAVAGAIQQSVIFRDWTV